MPEIPPSEPAPRRPTPLGAIALIVIGVLILLPSGLCTGLVGVLAVISAFQSQGSTSGMEDFTMALVFGGPFLVVGGLLLWGGLAWRRRR